MVECNHTNENFAPIPIHKMKHFPPHFQETTAITIAIAVHDQFYSNLLIFTRVLKPFHRFFCGPAL